MNKFSKQALVNSDGFTPADRVILKIVLADNKAYTVTDAQKLIKKFKGGI